VNSIRLLAIDPSSTCCGAAAFREGKLVNAWRITPERRGDEATARVTSMIAELKDIAEEEQIDEVVIEEPLLTAIPGRHQSNAVIQRAFGRIFQAFLDAGYIVHAVPVNVWSRGRGKVQRASVIVGLDKKADKGLDGADAIGLGNWFLSRWRTGVAAGTGGRS
jgi:hypothetical protein